MEHLLVEVTVVVNVHLLDLEVDIHPVTHLSHVLSKYLLLLDELALLQSLRGLFFTVPLPTLDMVHTDNEAFPPDPSRPAYSVPEVVPLAAIEQDDKVHYDVDAPSQKI